MKEYIQKIEGWTDQIKDEETGVEDYDFLEEAVTGGNTLGNIGSYLAVYETEDGLYVDDDLLEALDQKKTEIARRKETQPYWEELIDTESQPSGVAKKGIHTSWKDLESIANEATSHRIKERTNHREAVYGDLTGEQKQKIRNGEKTIQELRNDGEIEEGLLDGSFNGENSGHGFVQNMINEFKRSSNYEEVSRQNTDHSKKDKDAQIDTTENPNQEIILPSGGVKIMTDYEELNNELDAVYDSLDSLEDGLDRIPDVQIDSELETLSDEITDVRNYVSRIENALAVAQSDTREMEETIKRDDQILEITASTLGSIAEKVNDYGEQLDEYVDSQNEVTASLNGALDTLQEIGGGASYDGPSEEVRQIMDDRLDDEGFEEFQEAANRFE